MKLWLLRNLAEFREQAGDCYGFVVRAESERDARSLAEFQTPGVEPGGTWLRSELSSCVRLTEDGPVEVVLTDYYET